MTHKLQIRLLDQTNALLGWTEIQATAHGDGQLWTEQDIVAVIDQDGVATMLSIHWVDINVEIRTGVTTQPVCRLQVVTVLKAGPIFRVGPMATGLPPITFHAPINVSPPTATLGAMGMR